MYIEKEIFNSYFFSLKCNSLIRTFEIFTRSLTNKYNIFKICFDFSRLNSKSFKY